MASIVMFRDYLKYTRKVGKSNLSHSEEEEEKSIFRHSSERKNHGEGKDLGEDL